MKAVVLLGGQGTRLRPLTLDRPKQALPIVEVPMIERVLDHLALHGVTEAVLSLGYRHDAFGALFGDDRCGSIRLVYAVEPEPLDTAGAIAFAARHGGLTDTFLVANGDILTDLDVTAMEEQHRRSGAATTISLAEVADPRAFGLVRTGPGDKVMAFVEKPTGPAPAEAGWVSAGTYVMEPDVLDLIPPGARMSVERQIFPVLVARGGLYGFKSDAYWTDTGTPRQYLAAQLDLLAGHRPGPPAPAAVSMGSGVWTMGAATLDGTLEGPVLVGDSAVLAPGSRVANSVVGAGCEVGPDAVVVASILLPRSKVGAGARVQDSIVGHGAQISAGVSIGELAVIAPGQTVVASTPAAC
ncbi:MAG: sugar phosphate nucleotidyltransferase [Acidimicrobiales bacterium]